MLYDLQEILSNCDDVGYECRQVGDNQVDIVLAEDITLQFVNYPDDDDCLIGFDGTPWHTHDDLILMTGERTYIECDSSCILQLLRSGDILVISRYDRGGLVDRWLAHTEGDWRQEQLEEGEELRAKNVAEQGAGSDR